MYGHTPYTVCTVLRTYLRFNSCDIIRSGYVGSQWTEPRLRPRVALDRSLDPPHTWLPIPLPDLSDSGPRGPCHVCVSCHLSAWLVGVVSAPRLRPVSHVKQNQQQPKVAFRHRQHSLHARGGGHSRESNTHDTGGALREHFLERLFFGRGASCEHGRAEGGWRGRGGARVCSRRPFRPHEPHTHPTAA